MSTILFSVRKETHSRCTKIAEKKCSALLYEHKMNLYLLGKTFIVGSSRFQLKRISSYLSTYSKSPSQKISFSENLKNDKVINNWIITFNY